MSRSFISGISLLGLGAVSLCTLLALINVENWLLELFSHFKAHYLTVLLVLSVPFVILKYRKALVISTIFVVINLFDIAPLYLGGGGEVKEGTEISICSINLLSSNGAYEKTGNYIQELDPDILVLEELTELWQIGLDSITSSYPYQLSNPRQDNFGIGLYSKIPLDTIRNVIVNDALLPSILCEFRLGSEPVSLLATHPLPPVGQYQFESRNNAMSRINQLQRELAGHFILVGDLNNSSFSPHFKKFQKQSELLDTRKGFGILNTWNANIPLLNVTLDHCLISGGLVTVDRKVGPNIGSDHLPIEVIIGIRE